MFYINVYILEIMKQVIAHIDMDCFFCACEEKKNPSLKDKAVIVGGTGDRGVVSASNYNARKYGVFSATPLKTARRLCPDGIYLNVDMSYYKNESIKIMNILNRFTDTLLQVSVDEAYLDLTEYSKQFDSIEHMTEYIKESVLVETELTCSIGLSESKIVSKIASDFNKPNGITIVRDMKAFLENLPIGKIPGIGKKTKEIYIDYGIKKIGDLTNKKNSYLYERFGEQGITFKRIAEGKDRTKIKFSQARKSISRETTLTKNTTNIIELENELNKICEQVFKDLDNGFFKNISIKIRYKDFTTLTRDKALISYENSLESIKKNGFEIFRKTITSKPVRLIGLKLGNIVEKKQKTLENFKD